MRAVVRAFVRRLVGRGARDHDTAAVGRGRAGRQCGNEAAGVAGPHDHHALLQERLGVQTVHAVKVRAELELLEPEIELRGRDGVGIDVEGVAVPVVHHDDIQGRRRAVHALLCPGGDGPLDAGLGCHCVDAGDHAAAVVEVEDVVVFEPALFQGIVHAVRGLVVRQQAFAVRDLAFDDDSIARGGTHHQGFGARLRRLVQAGRAEGSRGWCTRPW